MKKVLSGILFITIMVYIPNIVVAANVECYILNPLGSDAIPPDIQTVVSGSTTPCGLTCTGSTAGCCNIEGQYTWETRYVDSESIDCGVSCSGVGCDAPAKKCYGNAYNVNWATQEWCTQACIGNAAGWNMGGEVSPNACCGDDAGENIIDCLDNGEGLCAQAWDTDACCDQGTDCAYNDNCYSQDDQTGGWECGTLVAGEWHDVVNPWADIKINNDATYTNTPSVTLNLDSSDGGSGVSECGFANETKVYVWESCSAGPWTKSPYTLSGGEGVRTVYFRVNDTAGNSVETSDTIIMDTTDPIAYFEPPLPEYIGPGHDEWEGNKDGSIAAFNVSWTTDDISGAKSFQVQYNTSTMPLTNWPIEGIGVELEGSVASYDFDSIQEGQVLDRSGNNNDGTVYGNTKLLMRFDEDDGAVANDESAYSNDGAIYGNTKLLMHFDEGDGAVANDETFYGNDGILQSSENQFGSGEAGYWHADVEQLGAIDGFSDVGKSDSPGGCCEDIFTNQFMTSDFPGWAGPGKYLYMFFWFKGDTLPSWEKRGTWVKSPAPDPNNYQLYILKSDGQNIRNEYYRIYYTATTVSYIADPVVVKEDDLPAYVTGKSGSALEFDGVDDYVDLDDPADGSLDFGTGDFTLSAWIKTSTTGVLQDVIDKRDTAGYLMGVKDDNKVHIFIKSGANSVEMLSTSTVTDGNWYHIVGVFDRDGVASIYIDGELDGTPLDISSIGDVSNSGKAIIGYHDPALASSWGYFNGIIDEVSIYSKALSQEEVEALYNESRAKFIEEVPGRYGNALEFDGVDDWIQVNGDVNMVQSAMTISLWFYTDNKDTNEYFADNRGPGTWWFIKNYSGGTCGSFPGNICFNDRVMAEDSDWNTGEWTHIVVTDDTTTAKMYINGELVDTGTGQPTDITTNLRFGTRYTNSGYFNGTIDEVSIYSEALSQEEVEAIYNESRARFIEEVPGRFGNALEFDGVDDYVMIPVSESLNSTNATGEVTIVAWIKTSKTGTIIDGYGASNYGPLFRVSGSNLYFITYDSVTANSFTGTTTSFNVIDSSWHHVAVVADRSSGKLEFYVDGVNESMIDSTPGNQWGTRGDFYIGWRNKVGQEFPFNGTIDEVAIYNRALTPDEIGMLYSGTDRTEWTFGPEEPVDVEFLGTYSFRVRALDGAGNLGPWSPLSYTTIVDVDSPELNFTAVDQVGRNLLGVGLVSHEDVDYVVVASSAMDIILGLKEHYIDYCKVYGEVEECKTEDCGPKGPEEVSSCGVTIDFEENTVIKLRGTARDLAGNWNISPDRNRYWFITDHALVNFIARQLDIIIGDSAVLRVQVRNIQNSFDNITLDLSGYQLASFADTGEGELSSDRRSLWIGLNPYEEKDLYVRVFSSSIGESKIHLNATSSLTGDGELCWDVDCVKDSDMVSITIGYTFEFPGLNIWGILLLVMVSLIVYSRLERKLFL